jgi:hypothetical protein
MATREKPRADTLLATNQKMKDVSKEQAACNGALLDGNSHIPTKSEKEKTQKIYTNKMLNDRGKTQPHPNS